MEKSLPVEGCSSHFSCIVADMFNFFVSRLSNKAAIVSKLLSKSDCGNERRATILNGLSGGCRLRCPGMGGEGGGEGKPNCREERVNWTTNLWCSYMNDTFCFSLFVVSVPAFYSLGKFLLFMHLIRSIQRYST